MSHRLQCRCGTIQGCVGNPRSANRAVCYCNKRTPFFHADSGTPIVSPRVLSGAEHAKLMDAVRGATG